LSSAAACRGRYSIAPIRGRFAARVVTDRDVSPARRRARSLPGYSLCTLRWPGLNSSAPAEPASPVHRRARLPVGWLTASLRGRAASLAGHIQRRSRDRWLLTRQYRVAVASCNDRSCWHASHPVTSLRPRPARTVRPDRPTRSPSTDPAPPADPTKVDSPGGAHRDVPSDLD